MVLLKSAFFRDANVLYKCNKSDTSLIPHFLGTKTFSGLDKKVLNPKILKFSAKFENQCLKPLKLKNKNNKTFLQKREIKLNFFSGKSKETVRPAVGSESVMSETTNSVTGVTGGPPKLMIVSDLDFTMVDHKDPSHASLCRFNEMWTSEYSKDSLLVFSTGRSPSSFQELSSQVPLLTPGIAIVSVGTEILYGENLVPDLAWIEYLSEGWNREEIVEEALKFPQLQFQKESEQRPHKVSFHVEKSEGQEIIEKLSQNIQSRGLKVNIIYSGGYALDLLPERAGKGKALTFLLKKLEEEEKKPMNTLACGDSGNDQELFTVEGAKGVIVGNAMEELVEWYKKQSNCDHIFRATERCAGGIMQAIRHFDL